MKFLKTIQTSTLVLLVVILVLASATFLQHRTVKHFRERAFQEQVLREKAENNLLAASDTLRNYKTKEGKSAAEIAAYSLSLRELQGKYSDLFGKYEKEKNKPPVSIVKTEFVISERVVDLEISEWQNGKNGYLEFSSDTVYTEGNFRSIKGKIPFSVLYFTKDSVLISFDSTDIWAKIKPETPTVETSMGMSLLTGLRKDENTGHYSVWAETKYPNVTFTSLVGADIQEDPLYKDFSRSLRKEWGIGIGAGAQLTYDANTQKFVPGFGVTVGLHFSPKILQFGR
jgi:hypothetical protein